MAKTDELISKLEEYLQYILKYACVTDSDKSIRMTNFENEISQLKEQIKKEETLMEQIREVFEPIQLGENSIVNAAMDLASKKSGKKEKTINPT
jgi:hypothetical protein